ncbi:PhnA domain-containing protein [Endothiovibrio diazotrophicus]
MTIEQTLQTRADSRCELCGADHELAVYAVPPDGEGDAERSLLLCATCREQIEDPEKVDPNHWRCLNDAMWKPVPAIQVMSWRMLTRLATEGWPQELLDMLYLDEETLAWAQADGTGQTQEEAIQHLDSNGAPLQAGDTVTLIKDLNVKGANFTAKRGTAVRNISLVHDNPEQIEGRVEGQRIVILTQFVKKSG